MTPEEAAAIIEKFLSKLSTMTGQLGRGDSNTPGSKKTGSIPGAKKTASSDAELREHAKLLKQANDKLAAGLKLNAKQEKAKQKEIDDLDDLAKATDKLEKSTDKLSDSWNDTGKAFKRFGSSMISSNVDVKSAMGSLGSSLSSGGTAIGKFAAGVLSGAGYMLGGMQEFAKNAADMGAFADLGTFRVGSVTQMKILSGLGNSFIKVIEGSKGGFRAFGANSEDAAENLSNLSRGLKYGGSYLNTAMKKTLGTDFVKSVNRASNAAAAMGLTDEARADLMGSLAQSSSLGATSEVDAQQRLVKQYADTLENTRKLSNAFGISSTEILKAMAEFRGTRAGQAGALAGNEGAQNLAPIIKELLQENDPEKVAKIALGLSSGNYALAQANVSNAAAMPLLDMLNQSVQGTKGGTDTNLLNKNLKSQLPWMENFSKERIGENFQGLQNEQYSAPGIAAGVFAKRMAEGGKDEGKKAPGVSEANNIKSMNTLEAALGSLRSAVLGLTATMITTFGTLGALLAGGAIGGLLSGAGKGAMGSIGSKVGGMFGKKPELHGPPKPPHLQTGGMFDKMSGSAGKGMGVFGSFLEQIGSTGAVKGAATLAILGGALLLAGKGFKEFNEVNWESVVKGTVALGGLVVVTKIMSAASTAMIKGAMAIGVLGGAMWVAGKGFKEFNDINWESLAKAGVAIAGLGIAAVAMGAFAPAIIVGSIALAALGAAMFVFAKGVKQFNDVEWGSLAKGVVGIVGLGIAVTAISPALAVMLVAAIPLVAFGAALGIFAMGIKQFNDVEWSSVGKGVIGLLGLGVAVTAISPALAVMLIAAIPLVAFGAALGIFALGVKQFNDVDWGSTLKGMLAMVGLSVAMVAISPALAVMLVAAIPLVAFGAALGIFAMGVKQFNEVDWSSIPKGLAAITALAFGVMLISPALAIMAIASIPLLAFGAALGVFALGIKQFNDVDWDSAFKGVLAIGALGLAVTGLAVLLPGILLGSIAMTVLAVSVAALGIALIPAAFAAKMFADSLETVSNIDGDNLVKIGAGLGAIGAGMVAFAAGMIVGTASSVLTGIMSLFGAKSPLDKIMEFVPYADAISAIGTGIKNFGEGVLAVQQGTADMDTDILGTLKDKLLEFAKAGSSDEMKLTAQYLAQIGSSLTGINSLATMSFPDVAALAAPADMTANLGMPANASGPIGNMLNNSAITPDIVAQLMSYLSSIENDLAAIRGNTKSNGNEAPVRLA